MDRGTAQRFGFEKARENLRANGALCLDLGRLGCGVAFWSRTGEPGERASLSFRGFTLDQAWYGGSLLSSTRRVYV